MSTLNHCIIFCAGSFTELLEPVKDTDFLIAADGGLVHMQRLGLQPRCILGDFDSLGYVPEDARVYPVEKDDTDTMLAVRRGLALGYRSFVIYGGLDGPRLDHTVANFQVLQFLAAHGAFGYLVGNDYIVTTVQNESLVFPETASGILSVFCLGPEARGITLSGLQYPLTRGDLRPDFPLGVSNHFIGEKATVRVENGSVLVIYDRQNGFPIRQAMEAAV